MAIVNTSARKAALPPIMAARLDDLRRRESSLRFSAGLMDALALFLAALFVALVLDWSLTLFSTSVRAVVTSVTLVAGAAGVLLLAIVPRFQRRTLAELATKVDRSVPGLEERWETVTGINAASEPEAITAIESCLTRWLRNRFSEFLRSSPPAYFPLESCESTSRS